MCDLLSPLVRCDPMCDLSHIIWKNIRVFFSEFVVKGYIYEIYCYIALTRQRLS